MIDKSTFFKNTYGMYLITSKLHERLNGFIANAVLQVSSDPPLFAVSAHKDNLTTDFILQSEVFLISVLPQDLNRKLIGKFGFKSGKEIDKFTDTPYRSSKTGAPIVLDDTIAYTDCKLTNKVDLGTHWLFIGLVIESYTIDNKRQPLTYMHYREVIKGFTPPNSPSFVKKTDQ